MDKKDYRKKKKYRDVVFRKKTRVWEFYEKRAK